MPSPSSSQGFLQFKQIKNGVMVLKNKAMRGFLMISSVNFDLKSEDEQNAIIYQFQGFLNSLDFSAQICVQSRRLNITGYFEKLKQLEDKQTNELLRTQTTEYRKFMQSLVAEGTIMTKQFFVIVPYTLGEVKGQKKSLLKPKIPTMNDENFKMAREQLLQRMEFVAVGLKRCGLSVIPLTTPEIIELFWSWLHPKEAEVGYYPEILPELTK